MWGHSLTGFFTAKKSILYFSACITKVFHTVMFFPQIFINSQFWTIINVQCKFTVYTSLYRHLLCTVTRRFFYYPSVTSVIKCIFNVLQPSILHTVASVSVILFVSTAKWNQFLCWVEIYRVLKTWNTSCLYRQRS